MITTYELTSDQHRTLLDAGILAPVICLQSSNPPSVQERVNAAWSKLGKEMGFDPYTVGPSIKGEMFFTAKAIERPSKDELLCAPPVSAADMGLGDVKAMKPEGSFGSNVLKQEFIGRSKLPSFVGDRLFINNGSCDRAPLAASVIECEEGFVLYSYKDENIEYFNIKDICVARAESIAGSDTYSWWISL